MKKIINTQIEEFVINKVKELRIVRGLSQEDIARMLDTTRGFVGMIESSKHNAKYNLNHINLLADEFDVSPKDFLPLNSLEVTRAKKKIRKDKK